METNQGDKMKHTEHTANLALSQAGKISTLKVGVNFAKPIPRIVRENKKSFFAQFSKKAW